MKKLLTLFLMLTIGFFTSCSDDDPIKLVSAFSFEKDNKTVSFKSASVNANSFLWDFGDGTTSTEENPVHDYADFKSYTVKLTASNENLTDDRIVVIDLISKFQKKWKVTSAVQTSTTFGQVNASATTDPQANKLITYLLSGVVSSNSNALNLSIEQGGEITLDGVSANGVSSWEESGGELLINSSVAVVANNSNSIVGVLNADGTLTITFGDLGSQGAFPAVFHPAGLPPFIINAIVINSLVVQLSAN
tara:strand:+ start:2426 stop:3172 length:747 start_codon:yes stop_codon:yes gene_type:complete